MRQFLALPQISRRQVDNCGGYNALVKAAGLEPNQRPQDKKPVELEPRTPKILIFDIETSPILAYVYGLWNQNVSTGFIEKDWYVFSVAAKFLDEKRVHYLDTRKEPENDKEVCEFIWKLLDKADVLVGHNSDRFDIKKLNTRFLYHGLPPIGRKKTVDTLKIAKKYFKITSNKLDYIAQFLGVEGKRKSKKFTNQKMWVECCKGNVEAFKENEKYNIQDIKVTEDVYRKLAVWDDSLHLEAITQKYQCKNPTCNSTEFRKDGFDYTKSGAFQRYRCNKCGKVNTSKHNSLSKEEKQNINFK